MKAFIKYWTVRIAVAMCAIGLIVTGCASTKNVMNKATFGLVGGGEKSTDQSSEAPQETKAERKAREKEEKQQREAEKRAAKEDEKARKAAAKEEVKDGQKPGMMSRMTFGLVGGEKKSKAEKQIDGDTKAAEKDAEKERKRRDKEAREQEEREAKALKRQQEQEAKAQKQQEKQAAKEQKEQEKAQAKAAKAEATSEPESTEEETGGKRTLMSRMTFGLVGGEKSETSDSSVTSETSTTATESTTSTMSTTATESTGSPPPPSDEPTKEDKKAQKRAEKEQREAEKQAKKDAEKAEKVAAKQAEAEEKQSEEAAADDQPKEKKSLMSRMTFGLVGGKKSDDSDSTDTSATSTESTTTPTEPEQPALPPEQIAMAAPTDVQYDVQPASALSGDAQKLAKMPFKTTLDYSTKSSTGKGQATASRETYSKSGYGITDIGDVRIAVEGMTFNDESRGGGVIISSDDRLAAGGKSGSGNSLFNYEYAKGVSAVQFGTVSFTIANSVVRVGEKSVPIGQGKKLIVLDGQGNLVGAYSLE